MDPGRIEDIAGIVDGDLRVPPKPIEVHGVSTDTRTISQNEMFVALEGPRHDGHRFLKEASLKGASAALVSQWPQEGFGLAILRVPDVLGALKRLAVWSRQSFQGPVVAITGSCGKTTVRSLLGQVLTGKWRTVEAEKSYNNVIGVSLTLLKICKSTEVVLLEMGTNHPGEIAELCEMADPTWGLVTGIGLSHVAAFRDERGVLQEKMVLPLHHTVTRRFYNADDPQLRDAFHSRGLEGVGFGTSSLAQVRATRIDPVPGWRTDVILDGGVRYRLGFPGLHNGLNSLACVAVGREMGLSDDFIAQRLESALPPARRCSVTTLHGITIIDDSYNANPHSVRACIDLLRSEKNYPCRPGRRILLLGDMLELGDQSETFHFEIGNLAAEKGLDGLWGVGPLTALAVNAFQKKNPEAWIAHSSESAIEGAVARLRPGDTVLVKGSRASQMDRIADEIAIRLKEGDP